VKGWLERGEEQRGRDKGGEKEDRMWVVTTNKVVS
jgi:hypothetical protein